jgi:hypothetical protein
MARSKSIHEVQLVDVKGYLRCRIADALHALKNGPLNDEAVHKARKDLKRARASLRLLRDAIAAPCATQKSWWTRWKR